MLITAPVGQGIRLRIRPCPEDCRYLIPDKEGGVVHVIEELTQGGTFVDMGAHIGYYSIVGADAVGREGNVIAFEPYPEHADRVELNAKLNEFDITVERTAISDETSEATLNIADRGGGHALGFGTGTITVPTIRFDNYVEENEVVPDLVKMDIEGAEVHALEGMKTTLKKYQPRIVCEVHPRRIANFGSDVGVLFDQITKHGYQILKLPERKPLNRTEFIQTAKEGVITEKGLETHLHVLAEPPSTDIE